MTDKDFLFGGGGLTGRTATWKWWEDDVDVVINEIEIKHCPYATPTADPTLI